MKGKNTQVSLCDYFKASIIPASEISHGYLLRMNSKKLKNTQHFSKSQAKAH